MLATFIVLILVAKLQSGLSLMVSAVVGYIFAVIISGVPFDLRYLVEGMFGYLDTILVITTAMIFMGALEASGALEYLSALLVKAFGRFPTLLLIAFMIIIMFPAMVTGSSLASAISAGALVAPIMMRWGIPKAKTGAIIAIGSILGMVAPPINVPAMVICDVVDIPFTDFELPLLLLTIPLAIVSAVVLGRKYVKPITKDRLEEIIDTSIFEELNWTCVIPLLVLIAFILLEVILAMAGSVVYAYIGSFAMTGMFVVSTIVAFFCGRKHPFWKKKEKGVDYGDDVPNDSIFNIVGNGVYKSFSAMGLLMGVGIFMEVLTLSGARGEIVTFAVTLPDAWKYIGMSLSLPLFGGISAFGSASMLGGPFVMAISGFVYDIMATGGLSMLAALGEFSPPTAMSATFAAKITGETSWTKITKAALPAMIIIFVYALIYTLGLGHWVNTIVNDYKTLALFIMLLVAVVVAVAFALVWSFVMCRYGDKIDSALNNFFGKIFRKKAALAEGEESAEGVQSETVDSESQPKAEQSDESAAEDAGGVEGAGQDVTTEENKEDNSL